MTVLEINDTGIKLWTDNADELPVLLKWGSEQFEDMKRKGLKDAWRWDFAPAAAKAIEEAGHE